LTESLRRRAEALWPAALAIHFIVLGNVLIPRGERLVHFLLLVGYLPLAAFIARPLSRLTSRQTASWIRLAIVAAGLIELVRYMVFANWIFELTAALAAILTIVALGYADGGEGDRRGSGSVRVLLILFAAAFAWMCAASLISWRDALQWIASSPVSATVLLAAIALTAVGLRDGTGRICPLRMAWLGRLRGDCCPGGVQLPNRATRLPSSSGRRS
jgi:hypothetical protein